MLEAQIQALPQSLSAGAVHIADHHVPAKLGALSSPLRASPSQEPAPHRRYRLASPPALGPQSVPSCGTLRQTIATHTLCEFLKPGLKALDDSKQPARQLVHVSVDAVERRVQSCRCAQLGTLDLAYPLIEVLVKRALCQRGLLEWTKAGLAELPVQNTLLMSDKH